MESHNQYESNNTNIVKFGEKGKMVKKNLVPKNILEIWKFLVKNVPQEI